MQTDVKEEQIGNPARASCGLRPACSAKPHNRRVLQADGCDTWHDPARRRAFRFHFAATDGTTYAERVPIHPSIGFRSNVGDGEAVLTR
jgi:hypothetical protein